MELLDSIRAILLNQHLPKESAYEPRTYEQFMPADYSAPKRPKVKRMGIVQQLNIYAKALGSARGHHD